MEPNDNTGSVTRPANANQDEAFVAGQDLECTPYFAPILFSLRVLDAPGLRTFAVEARHRLYADFAAAVARLLTVVLDEDHRGVHRQRGC